MSGNLLQTNRSNPCLVCGDTSGDCRTSKTDAKYFQCRPNSGTSRFEVINGYKNIGLTGCGGWGQFRLDTGATQLTAAEQIAQQAKRAAEQKAEVELHLAGLRTDERHAAYQELTAQLSLHPDDRADLQRRGLSEAAIASFVSIEPWQKLSRPIDLKTPAIGEDGSKVLSPYAGYLVPAKDLQGRVLGFQIRNRSGGKPKYPWLSTTARPAKLRDGCLPLTFADGDRTVVNFAEGLLKPMVAAEKLGQSFIGAAGGNFASSPAQLREYLSALSGSTLVLCPDAESLINPNVMRSYAALAEIVEAEGRSLKVRWYGQFTKADGDIDEISLATFENAQLITWKEFAAMGAAEPKSEPVAQSAPATSKTHRDYERPITGIWGEVAAAFNDSLSFKDTPALADLLPEKMLEAMSKSKGITSPQAIALKAYSAFLQKATQHDYQAEAQALIGCAWDWSGIPERAPMWGWKGFLMLVAKHCNKSSKAALKASREGLKKAAKDAKLVEVRAIADKWEMFPSGVTWLDSQFFGSAITDRVKAAGDERLALGAIGATGTGKSYSLKQLREWASAESRQFVYLTVKETLARSQGKELGLTYRLDLQVEDGGDKKQFPDLAGCGASLIENARGIDWSKQVAPNAITVIDEGDLFASVFGGVDAGSNALELQRVLGQVLEASQTVIIMSAQLKSRHMTLIKRLSLIDDSELIGIKEAAVKKSIDIWDEGSKSEELAEGDDRTPMESISLKNVLLEERADCVSSGKNVLTMTGAQKPDSKLGTMFLEQYDRQECGASSVLRLDSQSTKDPNHPAFKIADKDYVAAFRAHQVAICSPSAQEGFNLQFGPLDEPSHFDRVFAFDPGNKKPEQLIQDIGRDRHATKTDILVAPGHTQKKFGGTVNPLEVRRQLKAIVEQKETKLLAVANNNNPANWDSAWLAFYCEDVAQANASLADKAYNLARYLKAIGHEVAVKTSADGYPCTGIPEDFYNRISKEHYHQPVAEAAIISRFEAEEIQQKGEVTLAQYYQIQNLMFRQAMHWDVHQKVDPETGEIIHSENPHDNGLELDSNFVRQWSRDRVAKPWQMHFYAQQNEWDWFAHDFKKTRHAPKFENQNAQGLSSEDFAPSDILSLMSRKLSVMKELGLIEFMNRWCVDAADAEILSATSAKELALEIQDRHPESRFTKSALDPIVEKLKANFETTCELLGIKSQRNDDGGINHRQALTILRNVFQVKTFTISDRALNGERGVYVLVADDRAQAFRKEMVKADKKKGEEKADRIEAAIELWANTHNRIEMSSVWGEHLEVERAQLKKFLEEKSYKIDLLDDQRPEHWESLKNCLAEPKPELTETTEAAEVATKPADKPSTEAEPLTEAEKVLMFRLNWCQSFDEYSSIRNELETHCVDFEGRYWVLLPDESQRRICAFPQPVNAQ